MDQYEMKMKNKVKQLRTREKNLVVLEEELKTKMNSISKELTEKDSCICKIKKK